LERGRVTKKKDKGKEEEKGDEEEDGHVGLVSYGVLRVVLECCQGNTSVAKAPAMPETT